MNECLKSVLDVIREIKNASNIKVHRGLGDFLADKITVCSTEKNLNLFMERLIKLLDANVDGISEKTLISFVKAGNDSIAVLEWLRKYPKIASMIIMIRNENEYLETLEDIIIEDVAVSQGQALFSKAYDIPLTVTCQSPLSHGSDIKAGNATLFRRMQILSTTGQTLSLPFYAGNALRGQIRDLLADHFLNFLGIMPKKSDGLLQLWFFHALYAGGALEENATQLKAVQKKLGSSGIIRGRGVYEFRNNLPLLSLLGVALGNRILSGKINVGDLRPCCREWGTGEESVASLFEWTFLTRREDNENHLTGENKSMIANSECLKTGTRLIGGIDISQHITDIEKSCLGMGLNLLQKKGYIGAENRRGLGQVEISISNIPDGLVYTEYLTENKDKIVKYLNDIGVVLDAPNKFNINSVTETE